MSKTAWVKERIRRRVWRLLEESGVARFPRPVYGRIPNFAGAEKAALRLAELPEFRSARAVKVNPDSPQKPVRLLALRMGKTLLMPTPRIREGFLLLDPGRLPETAFEYASTIRGAFRYGRKVGLDELPKIDMIVVGSVAVSPSGARLGKGEGYSEIEYGVLRELGLIDDAVPVATTVHDLQVVEEIPVEEHDVMVDIIVTPTRVIRVEGARKPPGIMWDKLDEKKLGEIPILRELRGRQR